MARKRKNGSEALQAAAAHLEPPADVEVVVRTDGKQARLPGQERRRSGKVEKAAAAVELLQRRAKVLVAELDAARKTLLHAMRESGCGEVYQVDGVEVERTVKEGVKVDVPDEVLSRLGLLEGVGDGADA